MAKPRMKPRIIKPRMKTRMNEDNGEDNGRNEDSFPTIPGTLSATINGTATFQAGLMGDLTPGVQFRNKTDIDFNVRGKADNGLLYGLKLQLENITGHDFSSETTFEEAYVYLGGIWGRLEFGDTDDVVAGGLLVYAPSVGIGQIDGDYGNFSRLSLDTYYPFYPDLGSSTKINYYTPRIGGFQAGISYTPHLSDNGQSVVGFKPGRISTAPPPPPPPPPCRRHGACLRQAPFPEPSFSHHPSAPRPQSHCGQPQVRKPRCGACSGKGRPSDPG